MKRHAVWVHLAFLLAFCVFAYRHYSCKVDSDPTTYLRFANALARGDYFIDYPPDRVFLGHYAEGEQYLANYSTLVVGGKGVSFVAIGYPLFLAAFIAIGGRYAPFAANSLVFLVLFILLYLVVLRLFRGHPAARLTALLAGPLYFVNNRAEIVYLLDCYRDPLSYVFLLAAFLCLLEGIQGAHPGRYATLTGLSFGLAVTVRETSVIALFPMVIFCVREHLFGRRLQLLKVTSLFTLAAVLGMSPLLVQNTVNTGNPLHPTQALFSRVVHLSGDADSGRDDGGLAGLKPDHFARTAPRLVAGFIEKYRPGMLLLLALGLLLGRSVPGVFFFVLPFVVAYFILYGLYVTAQGRYIFIVHLMADALIAFGLAEVSQRLDGKLRFRRMTSLVLAGVISYAVYHALFGSVQGRFVYHASTGGVQGRFQIPQALRFSRDLEAALPKGAVVIAERPLKSMIDYFTHSYGLRTADFVRPDRGLSFLDALSYFRSHHNGVYFIDSENADMRRWRGQAAVTQQQLLEFFDLKLIGTFNAADYRIQDQLGKPAVTLFRVEEWTNPIAQHKLKVRPARDVIVRINARATNNNRFVRRSTALYVNGNLLSTSVAGGLSYYRVPAQWLRGGEAEVRMVSDAPLPADIQPEFFDLQEPILIDVGADATPLDTSVLSESFFTTPSPRDSRSLTGEGRVLLPTVAVPKTSVLVLVRHRLELKDPSATGRLKMTIDGMEQASVELESGGAWRTMCFPLTLATRPDRSTSEVVVRADVGDTASLDRGQQRKSLSIERFAVYRYDHADATPVIDIGGDDEMYIRWGLHAPEKHRDVHNIRWTDGKGRINLPCPASVAGRAAELTLKVWGPPRGVPPSSCRVMLNGTLLGEFSVSPDASQEFSFTVRPGLLEEGINEVQILSQAWRPSEVFGSSDSRRLGIMLDRLQLAEIVADPRFER